MRVIVADHGFVAATHIAKQLEVRRRIHLEATAPVAAAYVPGSNRTNNGDLSWLIASPNQQSAAFLRICGLRGAPNGGGDRCREDDHGRSQILPVAWPVCVSMMMIRSHGPVGPMRR